jgi:hypothetical protein
MAQQTWLFIRTSDDRLYYGRFWEYTNNSAGDVDTITIVLTERYARVSVRECLALGRSPLTHLSGSFVMKWSQIVDVNVASPDLMRAIRRQYAMRLRAHRARHDAASSPPIAS